MKSLKYLVAVLLGVATLLLPVLAEPQWKTYKNEELKYSFRYPANWQVVQVCTEVDPITRQMPSGMTYEAIQEKGPPVEGVNGLGKKVWTDNYLTRWAIYNYFGAGRMGGEPATPAAQIEWLVEQIRERNKKAKIERTAVSLSGQAATKVVIRSNAQTQEMLMLPHGKTLLVLHNLDPKVPGFNTFSQSLKP